MDKRIVLVTIVAVLLLTTSVLAASQPSGQPFQAIWDEIAKIWKAIADLQTQGCECDIDRAEFDSLKTKVEGLESLQECISGQTRPCGTDVGECKLGTQTCINYHWSTVCVGEVGPTPEVCDGKDNDCNGAIDDGLTQLCPLQQGVCAGATQTCENGGWTECNYGDNYEVQETLCDNKDNDCDGLTDEGGVCPTCAGDNDCTAGKVCELTFGCVQPMYCVPGCHEDTDCGAGQICQQQLCLTCPCPGNCVAQQCPQGEMRCGTSCVNPSTDPNNCGACGVVCAVGLSCVYGQCK